MTDFHDRFKIDGVKIDADIIGLVTSAVQTRTMDGASSIVLTLHDPDDDVVESGLLSKQGRPGKKQRKLDNFDQAAWGKFAPARAELDGWFLRLAGVSKSGPTLTLTFEDEVAWLMRQQTKATRSTRHAGDQGGKFGITRAEFIRSLKTASTKRQVGYVQMFCPERDEVQDTKKVEKDESRQKGLDKHAKLTIQGVAADDAQRRNLSVGLGVADDLLANDLATRAWIVAVIQESGARNLSGGDSSSVGILQLLNIHLHGSTSTDGGRRDVALVTKMFFEDGFWGKGGAIKLAKEHPDWSPGEVAQAVQGSAYPDRYDVWREEADAILDAWGGVSQTVTTRKRFSFKAGGKRDHVQHNYWDDAGDLAREVNWRLFADENILFFVSDNWLFGRQPVLDVRPDHPAIDDIDFDADVGTAISEITVTAKSPRWTGSPGACARVSGMGPVNGRWLLFEHTHDLLSGDDVYTLHRPAPKYKEPAPSVRTKTISSATEVDGGKLTYPLEAHGTDLGGVAAHKARAWGNWQSDNAVDIGVPMGTAVYAVDDGTITNLGGSWDGTGRSNPNGFNVTLKTKGNTWFYTHLKKRVSLSIGQKVTAGEYFGQSGAANGVQHLHIASEKGDPEKLLGVKDD